MADAQAETGRIVSKADRDVLYERLAAAICYERHHQHVGEFCPNCLSRANLVHGPLLMVEVNRIVSEWAAPPAISDGAS